MKSIERRFEKISKGNPLWSSYICFAEAVKEQKFSKTTLHRWFQKLVDKTDYARSDKRGILEHLDNLSNPLRTTEIRGKDELQPAQNTQAYNEPSKS
jgi:hypothetical protein